METIIEIGEYLANPVIGWFLSIIIILPAVWGVLKFLEWVRINNYEK